MIKIYHKTATIKAEQFDGSDEMVKRYKLGFFKGMDTGTIYEYTILTMEGRMDLNIGDWIATGVSGEHWTIADDVFKKTYAELPVIPRVWADTIKRFKANHYRLDEIFAEWDWNYDEQELIARAWLDGYAVEEEHD
ncbi:DUF1642 domain-containing protein [Lactiplantibacillus plantarum]|uniref:DUF1642 domain-containing protein n=1 Tax=Lactiplantibacillus plantarum TaxID=1590 RepID=UPI002654FD73|nr:DUF1642 domain-containing protein [Lactiplantibacillus plantarum]MDN7023141.1 DUF1642 domain-containing protein [Lactiplantibacillus plantarum]